MKIQVSGHPLFWHLKVGGEASSDVLLTGWLLEGVVVALGVLLWASWAPNLCGQWLEASLMAQMRAVVHEIIRNVDLSTQKVPKVSTVQ